ncbi:MAG: retropepsin-like aspartic protease, partial [Candidatus Angelobacter sp.]
ALDRNSARAWIGLGRIYSARSMQSEAKSAFIRAAVLEPEAFSFWLNHQQSPQQVAIYKGYLPENLGGESAQTATECKITPSAASTGTAELAINLDQLSDGSGGVRGLGAHVRLNDRADAHLLLDTAASGVTIGRKLAKKANVKKIRSNTVRGLGGSENSDGFLGRVSRLQIGDFDLQDCVVQVSSDNNVAAAEGIIGTDMFNKYLITIDFPAHQLRLKPLDEGSANIGAAASEKGVQALSFGHFLLLSGRLGNATGLFLIDSGSNTNTLSPQTIHRVLNATPDRSVVRGASGTAHSTFRAENATVQVANLEVSGERVVALDLTRISKGIGTEIAGQIGFSTLENLVLTIDYRDGIVGLHR